MRADGPGPRPDREVPGPRRLTGSVVTETTRCICRRWQPVCPQLLEADLAFISSTTPARPQGARRRSSSAPTTAVSKWSSESTRTATECPGSGVWRATARRSHRARQSPRRRADRSTCAASSPTHPDPTGSRSGRAGRTARRAPPARPSDPTTTPDNPNDSSDVTRTQPMSSAQARRPRDARRRPAGCSRSSSTRLLVPEDLGPFVWIAGCSPRSRSRVARSLRSPTCGPPGSGIGSCSPPGSTCWLSSAPGTRRGQKVSTAAVRSTRSTSTVIDSVAPPR